MTVWICIYPDAKYHSPRLHLKICPQMGKHWHCLNVFWELHLNELSYGSKV